jgi:hypothetical protein
MLQLATVTGQELLYQRFMARRWSTYGAKRAQPMATGGKSSCGENRKKKPNPLPWVATSCRCNRMLRKRSIAAHSPSVAADHFTTASGVNLDWR